MRKFVLTFLALFLLLFASFAQKKTITGTVTDDKGNPVSNATIEVKGTKVGTITNTSGAFTLDVSENVKKVQVSSIGFYTQNVDVSPQGRLSVSLAPSTANLDEVVITGYSTVKKSQYSGAATKVTSDDINYVPNASFDQILQGKAPGLTVTAGSGQPGAAARVEIRGATSITGGNSPLFVIDGMPVEAGAFQSINPNDFESIDVLRNCNVINYTVKGLIL